MFLLGAWRLLLQLATISFFLLLLQGHHSLHRDIPSSRYSFYTFRTARSDDSPPSPVDSYSDSYGRGYRSSPHSSSYFSGSSGSNTGSGNVRFPLSNSVPTLSQVSQVKTLSSAPSTGQFLSSTANPVVIRHPNSCSYDRSHAACTFSLLCYLANGVPVEGCEDNSSMTCCYLNAKGISGALLSGTASESVPSRPSTSTIYRHVYPASGSESTGDGSLNSVSSYRSPVSTYHPAPNSISKYYNPNNDYRTVQSTYQTSDIVAPSAKASLEPSSYVDSNYKIKEGLLAPYESKSLSVSKVDSDYYNNAIRRTRTDGYKSFFQEIANRKLYARNYDVEDICGKPVAKPQSRIIGGQDAYYGEIPWMVHIKITKHQCGGALINEQFVITAAHCIFNAPMRQLNVIIGAHDIEDPRFQDVPPQYFSVSKVILHPNFRFSASHPDRYDIALIKLDKTVRFSDSVLPVCLPEKNFQFEGWRGIVTGWGKTDAALSNRFGTRLLQKVEVPIIDNDKCESWHRTRGIDLRIFLEMSCAGFEDGQKDACVGDSGGPLVVNFNGRWTLVGVTSAGFGCAQARQPGIYHRVSHTVDWIKSTILSEKDNPS